MTSMYKQAFKEMAEAIDNWSNVDVRTVPGVMYQIRCGIDENDPTIEYRMNYFLNSSETFVHNHRHSFETLCLEGEYLETTWEITEDDSENVVYQFYRRSGNILDAPKQIPGILRSVRTRRHFPGNQMHVDTNEYHSISPVNSNTEVFTFLRRKKHTPSPDMYVLSSSPIIDAPTDKTQLATNEERQIMYDKLVDILTK